jgi:hypothetical protein
VQHANGFPVAHSFDHTQGRLYLIHWTPSSRGRNHCLHEFVHPHLQRQSNLSVQSNGKIIQIIGAVIFVEFSEGKELALLGQSIHTPKVLGSCEYCLILQWIDIAHNPKVQTQMGINDLSNGTAYIGVYAYQSLHQMDKYYDNSDRTQQKIHQT